MKKKVSKSINSVSDELKVMKTNILHLAENVHKLTPTADDFIDFVRRVCESEEKELFGDKTLTRLSEDQDESMTLITELTNLAIERCDQKPLISSTEIDDLEKRYEDCRARYDALIKRREIRHKRVNQYLAAKLFLDYLEISKWRSTNTHLKFDSLCQN